MAAPRGIKWSAPVLIRKEGDELVVSIPRPAAEALNAAPGDVLNFTELPDGSIEVWTVKKSTYASLGDMEKQQKRNAGAKGGRRK
jgi:antitoxin component of MazEF toxin-antitoxin module